MKTMGRTFEFLKQSTSESLNVPCNDESTRDKTYVYMSDDSFILTRLFPVDISGLRIFLDYWIAQ